MNLARALPACILACAVGLAHAQIYKCVDERGVVSYSELPRPGCKGGKIDIRPIPPVGGKVTAPGNDIQEQEADFRRRNLERAEAESKDRAAREREQTARRNYCDGFTTVRLTCDWRSANC